MQKPFTQICCYVTLSLDKSVVSCHIYKMASHSADRNTITKLRFENAMDKSITAVNGVKYQQVQDKTIGGWTQSKPTIISLCSQKYDLHYIASLTEKHAHMAAPTQGDNSQSLMSCINCCTDYVDLFCMTHRARQRDRERDGGMATGREEGKTSTPFPCPVTPRQ